MIPTWAHADVMAGASEHHDVGYRRTLGNGFVDGLLQLHHLASTIQTVRRDDHLCLGDHVAQPVALGKIDGFKTDFCRVRKAILVEIADHDDRSTQNAGGCGGGKADRAGARDIDRGADADARLDRAMEAGRPMLRSTNTGMTAIVMPDGSVPHVLKAFTTGAIDAEVRGYGGLTPYARWGNWPVLAALAAILLLALWRRRQ